MNTTPTLPLLSGFFAPVVPRKYENLLGSSWDILDLTFCGVTTNGYNYRFQINFCHIFSQRRQETSCDTPGFQTPMLATEFEQKAAAVVHRILGFWLPIECHTHIRFLDFFWVATTMGISLKQPQLRDDPWRGPGLGWGTIQTTKIVASLQAELG